MVHSANDFPVKFSKELNLLNEELGKADLFSKKLRSIDSR
jgi:hypothetical protein